MQAMRCDGGDKAKLVSLPVEDVVVHSDGGGRAVATKKPVVGSILVAQFIIAVTRTVPSDVTLNEMDLNGTPSLVLKKGERAIVAILIDTDGGRIRSVFVIANPAKLDALALPCSLRSGHLPP